MKLPNLRLHETQAKASVLFGALAIIVMAGLAFCVFKGYEPQTRVIPYNPQEGTGRFRPYLVYGATAVTLLIGATSGLLGFNSLGQKRNNRQALSWLGMFIGAMAVSIAPVLFFAWQRLKEPLILGS